VALPIKQQVLFNPGPVNLDAAIKASLFNMELCHRQPEFDELYERVAGRLFDVALLSPATHRLSLLHGSGSTAVDAGLTGLVRGRVLVVNNGFYCDRIAATLSATDSVAILQHSPGLGVRPDLEELDRELERWRPDWLAVVHHETTTGLLNPLGDIARAAERHGCRLFVDAVSSFGAHPIPGSCDVVCFNSNKCLESLPGIAGVFWSADLRPKPLVPVLDLAAYADAIPTTPNVQAFVALDVALDLLSAEDRPARYRRLARKVWQAGGARFELLLPEEQRSHVLASFRLGDRNGDELLHRALESGFVIYAGQKHLRDEIFRVANMGAAIDEHTIESLFEALA
jgi:2-aminoethylphosphonate-pyruvate transaminase